MILLFLFAVINLTTISNTFNPNVQGFEENRGQLGDTEGNKVEEVIFYTKYKDFGVYITEKGVSYVIYRYEEPPQAAGSNEPMLHDKYQMPKDVKMHYSRIDIDLVNSSIERSNIEYKDELPGYSNYYLGHCPEGVLFVKSYKEVRIKGVYKGIDWIWRYDDRGELHHEFELSEESAPEAIKLKINYSDYEITENGKKLILSTPIGKIEDGFVLGHRSESMIFPVEVRYRDNGDGTIGYSVSNWDRSGKLIIDPPLSLTWATYYGGNQQEGGNSIIADLSGNIFVTGYSYGGTFPLHNPGGGAYYQGTFGGGTWDAFILKFSNTGIRLWATLYGGDQNDAGNSICIDGSGNVFVTGETSGGTFPLHNPGGGAYYQGTYGGGTNDVIILKFSNTGIRLWATFYGGNQNDIGRSISLALPYDEIVITGQTSGGSFPLQDMYPGISYYQTTYGGGINDAFILRFSNSGARRWATFYGGNGNDISHSITLSNRPGESLVYVTGQTSSNNFPVFNPGGGAYFQGTYVDRDDIFILEFTSVGARRWATYYGDFFGDYGYSIATDIFGNIYVTGCTESSLFPLQDPGGGAYYQGMFGGGVDVFILKFSNNRARQWATFYGNFSSDIGYSITTDRSGNIFVTGETWGFFPLYNPGGGAYYQGTFGGGKDAFMLKFTNTGARQWATFYGGNVGDVGLSLTTDVAGNIFLSGQTNSNSSFPLQNPGGGAYYQGTFGGHADAFISKFGDAVVVSLTPIGVNTPESYRLYQNYPNPFNPVTKIRFDIPEERTVKLVIYDISGKELSVAVNQTLKAGSYEYTFDGSRLTSGIYFYRLEAGEFTETRRMILVK